MNLVLCLNVSHLTVSGEHGLEDLQTCKLNHCFIIFLQIRPCLKGTNAVFIMELWLRLTASLKTKLLDVKRFIIQL